MGDAHLRANMPEAGSTILYIDVDLAGGLRNVFCQDVFIF